MQIFKTEDGTRFLILAEDEDKEEGITLLCRLEVQNDPTPFITVRDLTIDEEKGTGYWYYGHYFTDIKTAVGDFENRGGKFNG